MAVAVLLSMIFDDEGRRFLDDDDDDGRVEDGKRGRGPDGSSGGGKCKVGGGVDVRIVCIDGGHGIASKVGDTTKSAKRSGS